MTSFQSTLGEGEGIAEELAESQRAISIAEFFEKNKHMLGFDSGARALVTAVKEAVDNALDATEEAGILPDIFIEIEEVGDYYRLTVEDNGPGITKEQVPKIFGKLLYGSRFHKREQSLTPSQRIMVRRGGAVEFLPIGKLCDAYLPPEGARSAPVPGNIEAPCFDRETQELTWQPVTDVMRHETDEQTYEITTAKGRSVEVTGNHSLFTVDERGDTEEVAAGELESGDTVLAPRRLPTSNDSVECVNVLDHLSRDQLEDRRIYVYGFDDETLAELQTDSTVRRYPSEDSDRKRYYYNYDGVEILRDSLDQNYIEDGYLPAEKVLELGWEERAADCELRTYQVGGEVSTIPVTLPADESLIELLAYYISEGHAGDRQVGLTFGSHETELVEATREAIVDVGGSTTTVERERNSTRVKGFGSGLAMFLESTCGSSAQTKRIPNFVFELDSELQRRFIAALYEGDGSESHPSNELSHTTTSETLARQLSTLWSMQGVVATTEVQTECDGYSDDPATRYRTKVFGEDVSVLESFDTVTEPGEQQYKRVPTSVLGPVRVGDVHKETVPDTIPGLLLGAGVGSNLEHADTCRSLIEDALDGAAIDTPRYGHNLQQMGLLNEQRHPTDRLRELWETIHELHGITESDMCLLEVEDVERTEPPEYVYDISVPGATGYDENFVVVNEGPLAVKNSRGQQGIGISAAVLYSQLTSGKPAEITSRPKGADSAQYFELIVDTDENEPEIRGEEETTWDRPHGTRIVLEMEANMRARQQLHDYVKHTAVVNPHARIELREPGLDEPLKSERATDDLPAETEEIRPHPHGVELGTLLKMLEATDSHSVSGFLQSEFTRVGKKTADGVVEAFTDRHFGRELAWTAPDSHEEVDVEGAVEAAVANKGATATGDFADRIATVLAERERISHHELVEVVGNAADAVEDEHGKSFGDTVREKATRAAWREVTGDARVEAADDDDVDVETRRRSDIYRLVEDATSDRKDDATLDGLARRVAEKLTAETGERDRVTHESLRGFVDRAADMTEEREEASIGDTARENVVEALWTHTRTVPDDPPKVSELCNDRNATAELLEGMREIDVMAPPTSCLAPITDELIEAGLRKEFDADFYAASTRDADVHGGDPFIVEAGIAYGGEIGEEGPADVMRFANRVPLVYQRGACATTDVVKSIGWRNYNLDQPGGSGIPSGPAVLTIHVASTNVPFTSESKDAVANVPAIEDEIELAIREAARDMKSYLEKRQSMQQRKRKQNALATILPEMASKVAEVTEQPEPAFDDALARIMNNVLVERHVSAENGTAEVALTVENNSGRSESLEITEIVSTEPTDVPDDASVVEMDGEWFVSWETDVAGDESATLDYETDADADYDLQIDGVESAKLTVTE